MLSSGPNLTDITGEDRTLVTLLFFFFLIQREDFKLNLRIAVFAEFASKRNG